MPAFHVNIENYNRNVCKGNKWKKNNDGYTALLISYAPANDIQKP